MDILKIEFGTHTEYTERTYVSFTLGHQIIAYASGQLKQICTITKLWEPCKMKSLIRFHDIAISSLHKTHRAAVFRMNHWHTHTKTYTKNCLLPLLCILYFMRYSWIMTAKWFTLTICRIVWNSPVFWAT